ncbi:unnamed protein product [Citrullus colocynthis]|uniref:Uncharacterized protein n=1 Tax=Citrullus colocynthis TaxID=252529 RepID=A0ABP0XUE3_9ROSI
MSMMDGRVLRLEEDMGYVKAQLLTITSLLQTLCKDPTMVAEVRSPTPPLEPDSRRSPTRPRDSDSRRSPTPHRDPDSRRSPTPYHDQDSRRSPTPSHDPNSRRSPTPSLPPPRSPNLLMLSPPPLPLSSPPRSPYPLAPNTITSSGPLPLPTLETTTTPPALPLPPPDTTTTSIDLELQTLEPLPLASPDSLVTCKSARPKCKRKGIESTPNKKPKKRAKEEKNSASSTQPKVEQPVEPKTKQTLKYPLPGVSAPIFRARVTYNLAHDIPSNIFLEMMSWIVDKNTDVDIRHNSYLPLSKKFFQQLTKPSSWVECDTVNVMFRFICDKFHNRPDMCMNKFNVLPTAIMGHLNLRSGIYKQIKNKPTLAQRWFGSTKTHTRTTLWGNSTLTTWGGQM